MIFPPSKPPPPPTLEEAKNKAHAALRAKRREIEYGGIYVNGQKWDSEEKDELRLNSVAKLFETGIPAYEGWKISEGVYITLTPNVLSQAALALMQHYGNAFAVEAAKLAEINALESVEAVETWLETDLNQGW